LLQKIIDKDYCIGIARAQGIEAEILFCLKKDWSGKPDPSGVRPNNG